jgi:hypothetical protein
MSAFYNPDPPGRCRATQSPGQETGIGAHEQQRLTLSNGTRSGPPPQRSALTSARRPQ